MQAGTTGKTFNFWLVDTIAPDQKTRNWYTGEETTVESKTSQRYFVDNLNGAEAGDTVNLYINSVGGSVKEALGIYSTLRRCPATVVAYIDGYAASAASVIAMAADKIIMPRNWQKIMPATSFRRTDGTWAHDILPIPAETMQTAALESGKAVLGIASRYFAGLGATGKDGTIVQDDSVRFFEDERAYKAKLQGNARPLDAYAFVLLDISALDTNPAALVQVVAPVVTKAES